MLQRLALDADYQPEEWDHAEIADYRLLVQCPRAAQAETDHRNMRVLWMRPEGGSPETARAHLGVSREIVLTFKTSHSQAIAMFELLTAEPKAPR